MVQPRIYFEGFSDRTVVVLSPSAKNIPNIATMAQMETNEIFWPKRGTCGLNPGDVGLVDGGLQCCEGCSGTPPQLLPTSIMASDGIENLQRSTRRVAWIDYEMLNGGPDSPDGGLPSDQLTKSDISQFLQFDPDPPSTDQESLLFSDILPQESALQTQTFA